MKRLLVQFQPCGIKGKFQAGTSKWRFFHFLNIGLGGAVAQFVKIENGKKCFKSTKICVVGVIWAD